EHATDPHPHAPAAPPPRIVPTRGRRRQVDTSMHFCPNPDCRSRGWAGWGNIRANGHPNGGPWRQLLCVACRGYFLETLGTLFHGKHASVELIVRVIACLAEGIEQLRLRHPARLGRRAVGLTTWGLYPLPIVGEQGCQILPEPVGEEQRGAV